MKSREETLRDLQDFQYGLSKLYNSVHTCNELHAYVSKIIHYLKINDVDVGRHDPYGPQLEVNICSINPKFGYGTKTSKSQGLFRTCQHESSVTLGYLVSSIQSEIEYANSAKNNP